MKKIVLLSLIFLFCFMTKPAFSEQMVLSTLINGKAWNGLPSGDDFDKEFSKHVKLITIKSFYQGAVSVNSKEAQQKYYFNTTYESLVVAIDFFYKDDKNIELPLEVALRVVAMEFRGENKESIETYLTLNRKLVQEFIRRNQ